jgi:hypothetical protein
MQSIRKSVMATYNRIKKHFSNFSDAMRAAWRLAKGTVTFAKVVTGEVRTMQIEYIGKPNHEGLIKVVETGTGYRSFYVQNIIF